MRDTLKTNTEYRKAVKVAKALANAEGQRLKPFMRTLAKDGYVSAQLWLDNK